MMIDVQRASVFAALTIVLAGYVLLFRPLETAVGERDAELDAARTSLQQNLALARRIPALERDRVLLAERLRHLHTSDPRAVTIERFLRTVAGVSAHDAVAVESVAAVILQPQPVTGRVAQAPLLEDVPLDVTFRGSYADVIRAARDLNAADAVANIALASLGNAAQRPALRPQINAAFHVNLLREPYDASPSSARAL